MKSYYIVLLLAFVASFCNFSRICEGGGLVKNFYFSNCSRAEQIVQGIVYNRVANNPELPAKLLRMFFHDCFVRGCDASILLDSTANSTAEKYSIPNLSLGGFDVLDAVKSALEYACPGVVSCADIIALAARDSVSYQFRKNLWEVKTGRRDGRVSLATEPLAQLPSASSNFATLSKSFASKGLSLGDLVVLSGAHTLGVSHCNLFANRLYNFTSTNNTDPLLDPTYAQSLRSICKSKYDFTTEVPMDPRDSSSSSSFDNHYFATLKRNRGLFESDAALMTDTRASMYVDLMLDNSYFISSFKTSITRMGAIGVLTGTDGEIRKKCNLVN